MAFLFKKGLIITKKRTYTSIINHAAKKSVDMADNGLDKLTTANRPFVSRNAHFMADCISHDIRGAIIDYQQRRYFARRGDPSGLLKDVIRLIWDVVWGFIGPLIYAIAMTLVYAAVSVSVFGLIFYLLFIL